MSTIWIALGVVFLSLGIVFLAKAKKAPDPAAPGNSKLPAILYFAAAAMFFIAAAIGLVSDR